jgi:sugar O-acyltransferase (sialic acid O-acetyltransferase NeuD family)
MQEREIDMQASLDNKSTHRPTVLLWGGKSQARIVAEMLRESGAGTVGVIFDARVDCLPFDSPAPFTNSVDALKKMLGGVTHYVVCIGAEHGYARTQTSNCLEKMGLKPLTMVHKRSFVEPTATLGKACLVMPGAVIHKFATIGVNTSATIDHECSIGNGVHIMGQAAIAGKVDIADYVTVGTHATILPYLTIGEGAFIGAGAVVTKDIAPYSVVTGMPARHIRKNQFVFHEALLQQLSS